MKVVILAAGFGTRLGTTLPKCLVRVDDERTILDIQIESLKHLIDDIYIVVGFKKEMIMEYYPELTFIYNPLFFATNTAKSLYLAVKKLDDDVLWLNGDVVFEPKLMEYILSHTESSFMAVTIGNVDEEAVKFKVDERGFISAVSKELTNALGEAVGINFVKREELKLLVDGLARCNDNDYFEKGIEYAIENGLKIKPLDISEFFCMEIDFEEDLRRAKETLKKINE